MRLIISLLLLVSGAVWAAEKDTCFECHEIMEGMSQIFIDDIHYKNQISCADCHGGDSKEEDPNLSMALDRGFKVRVTPEAVPEYCGECHSDASIIHKRAPKQPVDQVARYITSVHGVELAKGNTEAAQCVDCHGIHDIRAVSDPQSKANPANVSETCAKCHAAEAEAFGKSIHGELFTTESEAGCTACHDAHATQDASSAMLSGTGGVCVNCHNADTDGAKAAAEMAKVLAGLEAAASGGGADAQQILQKARVAVHTADPSALR